MPPTDIWDNVTVEDLWIAFAAFIVLILGIAAVVRVVHPMIVKVTQVLDLILGRPEQQGIPGEPSMMQRFDAQDEAIKAIKDQVTPNHGSTTKLAAEVQDLRIIVDGLAKTLSDHIQKGK